MTCLSYNHYDCGYHGYAQVSPGKGYNRYMLLPFLGPNMCHNDNYCFKYTIENNYAYAYSGLLLGVMTNPDKDNYLIGSKEKDVSGYCPGIYSLETASPPYYTLNMFYLSSRGAFPFHHWNCEGTTKTYMFHQMWSARIGMCIWYPIAIG